VAFEFINEPKDAATTTVLNPIYAEAIRQIRVSNPSRTLFVGPGQWNSINELSNLRLPDDDENLIVTVHCYDPFLFTHQGACWTLRIPPRRIWCFRRPRPRRSRPPGDQRRGDQLLRDYNTCPPI
jgi:hypothetical protein